MEVVNGWCGEKLIVNGILQNEQPGLIFKGSVKSSESREKQKKFQLVDGKI